MWCFKVRDESEAVLGADVGCLYACLFADLALDGPEWIGVLLRVYVDTAFKEAADDVVASVVNIYALTLVEKDNVVATLDNGTDGKRITVYAVITSCGVFFVACVSEGELDILGACLLEGDQAIERRIKEQALLLPGLE